MVEAPSIPPSTLCAYHCPHLYLPRSQVPGLGLRLDTTKLDLQYQSTYQKELPDAYERLLLDVVNGEQLGAVGKKMHFSVGKGQWNR